VNLAISEENDFVLVVVVKFKAIVRVEIVLLYFEITPVCATSNARIVARSHDL
jgi:hypothetical protein